jgi:hypothetical protein
MNEDADRSLEARLQKQIKRNPDEFDDEEPRHKLRSSERPLESEPPLEEIISVENDEERERLTSSPLENDEEPLIQPRTMSEQGLEDKATLLLTLGFLFPPLWGYVAYFARKARRDRTRQLGRIALALSIGACVLSVLFIYLLTAIRMHKK